MSSNTSKCPSSVSPEQKYEQLNKIMNSLGGDNKCRQAFTNNVTSSLQKADMAMAFVSFGGAGGGTASLTNSQNSMKESLSKAGCSDIFATVNQQMNSTENMLCEMTKSQSNKTINNSANASINIQEAQPDEAQLNLRTALISAIIKPLPPRQSDDNTAYNIAYQNYMDAIEVQKEEIANISGKLVLTNDTFENSASVDMQSLGQMSTSSVTAIAAHYATAAKASALQTLKDKAGLGATSDNVKSLVSNRINNKNKSITNSVNNHISNVKLSGSMDGSVTIILYGPATFTGVVFDQHAQGRLIANNIMTSATNLGKSVAFDLLSQAHGSVASDKVSSGEGKVFKQLYDGQLKLSKANAAGAANLFGKITGFLGMFAMVPIIIGVVVLLFFPQISNVIAPGPLKYVLAAVLLYIVLAWFIGFWPFSKSKKSKSDDDDKK